MIKIPNNTEFIGGGRVWIFEEIEGKITLRNLRTADKDNARNSKEFIPPTLDEVKEFFKDRGYTEESAIKFHDYYSLGNWKDGKGTQVKNWRQKASSVWFREDHKIKDKPKQDTDSKFLFG